MKLNLKKKNTYTELVGKKNNHMHVFQSEKQSITK